MNIGPLDPRMAKRRNLTRGARVQVNMRAGKRRLLPSATEFAMAGAVVLAVAACGVAGPLRGGQVSQPRSGQPPHPGTAVTVTMSRAPRPGSLTPKPQAPPRHRTITVPRSGHVTVTTADDGATVVLARGQMITVVLRGHGMLWWNPPRLAASMTDVLRWLGASGGYPSKSPARASYRAVLTGSAEILSGTSARCLHAHPPCAMAQRLWRIAVVVHPSG